MRHPDHEISSTLLAPDFPGGGQILYVKESLEQVYRTGRGGIKVRGRYTYDCLLYTSILSRAVRLLAEQEGAKRLETSHIQQMCALLQQEKGGISLPGSVTFHLQNGYFYRVYTNAGQELSLIHI